MNRNASQNTDRPLVLCVDANQKHLEELTSTIDSAGLRAVTAQNPGEALQQMILARPQVILVEPSSLGMDANALLRAAQKQDGAAQIIICSREDHSIDGMIRIFKYVRRPIHQQEILDHVKHALVDYDADRVSEAYGADGGDRVQSQLEWLVWRERVRVGDRISLISAVLDTIRHAISQGVGIGSLVTMAEMIQYQASRNPLLATALADSLPSLKDSALAVRQWMENIEKSSGLLAKRYPIEIVQPEKWKGILTQSIAAVEPLRTIKNQDVILHDDSGNISILSNRIAMDMMFRELLTNAFKYSPDASPVHVICKQDRGRLSISFRNDILQMANRASGVPLPYENQIFEPFFRIHNVFDERFRAEELGMGIGLTVVQGALNQFGGQIFVHEIVSQPGLPRRVTADITLPIETAGHEHKLSQNGSHAN
ncbi:MAG: hypothetical protein K8S54_21610 [Spirochaetia bacterium]|nr:hypothetical protein [Spirochaetia bacterium]